MRHGVRADGAERVGGDLPHLVPVHDQLGGERREVEPVFLRQRADRRALPRLVGACVSQSARPGTRCCFSARSLRVESVAAGPSPGSDKRVGRRR